MKVEKNDRPIDVPVEPLSEQRWARIERGIFQRLDAEDEHAPTPELRSRRVPPRAIWAVIAAAAVLLLLVIGLRLRSSTTPAPIAAASPSRIATGASESHLSLGESSLDIGADSTVLVSGDDEHGILVVLDRGLVTCEVAPRAGRPAFLVQAGAVRVRVIGTRFRVLRVEDSARVEVTRGVVEVSSGGETFTVGAGESWPRLAGVAPSATTIAEPMAESIAKTAKSSVPTASALKSVPDAGAVASSATVAVAPTSSAPSPTPQEQYESAARLEASQPANALALYRQVEVGSGPWAANALYAHGRLEAERGNRAEAKRVLNDYLTRFPKGPNAADCRALLERLK